MQQSASYVLSNLRGTPISKLQNILDEVSTTKYTLTSCHGTLYVMK